ncbi:uncharacterized protein CTRU02_210471 [Colletotrichum truncatum]|uniref:Uncharacterized protein n=1 Tax=Colletotrichum truncatum TaxID=5467 RepID=A0ACC3YPC4_COLTU|nr:uncharacterized protein CTRU02_13925 [Colletotrichum truncatum]KAF6782768.1 hypothetical protein CTRU02_13925 [Colletotrichum truncatum]
MVITEIGRMGVKPGIDIMDESKTEGTVLSKAYNTVTVIEGGPYRAFWGLEEENPLMAWAFFDFDSVEHHETFAKLHGAEISKDFPTVLTHGEFVKHLALTASSAAALRAPLSEIVFIHFPGDLSADDKELIVQQLEHTVDKNVSKSPGIAAISWGWSVENDFPVVGTKEQSGSVLALIIGWSGITSQKSFHETTHWKAVKSEICEMKRIVTVTGLSISCHSSERKEVQDN